VSVSVAVSWIVECQAKSSALTDLEPLESFEFDEIADQDFIACRKSVAQLAISRRAE